ncbi:hypothetical protein FO519_000111 [Halicephalobus sp. NKZ332]|nr:hypothetical protein FO519_000111 [Halicephalobus sp. NKZ332]
MMKAGFQPSSTLYVPSKAKKPEEPEQIVIPPYPVVSTFIFTDEQIANSPSRINHGIFQEEESRLRRIGTLFIRDLCRKLNEQPFSKNQRQISTNAMSVAMILFHRFYMFHSFGTFDPVDLAAAALFLAAKIEECPRRLHEFAVLLYSVKHPKDTVMLHPSESGDLYNLITALETSILRTLAFEVTIRLPQVSVVTAFRPRLEVRDEVRLNAYKLCADVLAVTDLCIRYELPVIAAVAFYIAASHAGRDLKEEVGEAWYNELSESLNETMLLDIVKIVIDALTDVKPLILCKRNPDSLQSDQLEKPDSPAVENNQQSSSDRNKDPEKLSKISVSQSTMPGPSRDHDSLKRKEERRNDHPPPKIPKMEQEVSSSKAAKVEPHHNDQKEHGKEGYSSNSNQSTPLDIPHIPGLEHKLPPPVERPYQKSTHGFTHHRHDHQRSHDYRPGTSKHDGHRETSSHSKPLDSHLRPEVPGRHPSPQKPSRKSVSEELEEGEIE